MQKIRDFRRKFETDSAFQTRFNLRSAYFWVANIVVVTFVFFCFPAVWAAYSVYYLVFISLYANFSTNYGAASAAEANTAANKNKEEDTSP